MLSMMALVNSEHLDLPPKSPVITLPSAMVSSTAFCTATLPSGRAKTKACSKRQSSAGNHTHSAGHGKMLCSAWGVTVAAYWDASWPM